MEKLRGALLHTKHSLALAGFRHLDVYWSRMSRYRYLHEMLNCITLRQKTYEPVTSLDKDINRMLKVGSVYPSRKRVSALLTPEQAAFSKMIGTGLRESQVLQQPLQLLPGTQGVHGVHAMVRQDPGCCYSSTQLRNVQSWWVRRKWFCIITVSRGPLLLRIRMSRDCNCTKAHCLSRDIRDICSEHLCGKTSYVKRKQFSWLHFLSVFYN